MELLPGDGIQRSVSSRASCRWKQWHIKPSEYWRVPLTYQERNYMVVALKLETGTTIMQEMEISFYKPGIQLYCQHLLISYLWHWRQNEQPLGRFYTFHVHHVDEGVHNFEAYELETEYWNLSKLNISPNYCHKRDNQKDILMLVIHKIRGLLQFIISNWLGCCSSKQGKGELIGFHPTFIRLPNEVILCNKDPLSLLPWRDFTDELM